MDDTLRARERMTHAANYFAWQSNLAKAALGRRVIEVGCGSGDFTRQILDRDLVIGVDIEPACVAGLLHRYGNRINLQAFTLDVSDPLFTGLARFDPDSIVCLNVLEHVQDDQRALRHMAGVLPPGGRVVLLVPAFPALYGRIDRNLGRYRRYTRQRLKGLARQAGLRVRLLEFMNVAGFFGWWVASKILRRTEQSEFQVALFDSRIVPFLSKLEAAIPPPFGENLFAVFERPV